MLLVATLLKKEIQNDRCNTEKEIINTINKFIININKNIIINTYNHIIKILN